MCDSKMCIKRGRRERQLLREAVYPDYEVCHCGMVHFDSNGNVTTCEPSVKGKWRDTRATS